MEQFLTMATQLGPMLVYSVQLLAVGNCRHWICNGIAIAKQQQVL